MDDSGRRRCRPSAAYTGDHRLQPLAQTLSDLARSLQNQNDLSGTLDGIVHTAVRTVPGARHAGITAVRDRRRLYTPAATDDLVHAIDQVQYETGEGPCVDAVRAERALRLADLAEDRRWPDFSRYALTLDVRSILSLQLTVGGGILGVLNLYSPEAGAFTDESEYVGLLFASHAAVALAGARRQRDLELAVAMRDLIGQAKGILMERHRITADEAFVLLTRASQRTNAKVSAVAQHLTETGELPR